MDLINTYRAFHQKAAEYTVFSSAHGIFSRIDHILGHRRRLRKFLKIKIISSIFSNHTMRLDISYKEKTAKNRNTWRLNNMLLYNQWITREIKWKFRKNT